MTKRTSFLRYLRLRLATVLFLLSTSFLVLAWRADRAKLLTELSRARQPNIESLNRARKLANAYKMYLWRGEYFLPEREELISTIVKLQIVPTIKQSDLEQAPVSESTLTDLVTSIDAIEPKLRLAAIRLIVVDASQIMQSNSEIVWDNRKMYLWTVVGPRLLALLGDEDPEVRGSSALGIGILTVDMQPALGRLLYAFEQEKDPIAKKQLLWAIDRLQ